MNIKLYTRRDDFTMIYINDDYSKNKYQRAKSIGIAEKAYTSSWTDGQKNLFKRFLEELEKSEVKITKEDILSEQVLDLGISIIVSKKDDNQVSFWVEKNGKFLPRQPEFFINPCGDFVFNIHLSLLNVVKSS